MKGAKMIQEIRKTQLL